MSYRWEAWYGTSIVDCGKKRNGKPRRTLVLNFMVATSEADAKAITKAHPTLKFKRTGRK